MSLQKYFETSEGNGVIATANGDGDTTAAVYARPHFIDDKTVAFIVDKGRTYSNLQTNNSATYLFIENGGSYQGKRLYLKKVGEENDQDKVNEFRKARSQEIYERYKHLEASLVYFEIDHVRPLVGQ